MAPSCELYQKMGGLIINDLERAFKRRRTWVFIGLLCVFFLVNYYVVSIGVGVGDFLARDLPAGFLMHELPVGTLFLLVFGIPIICGDFTAADNRSGLVSLYQVRGVSEKRLICARVMSSFISAMACCVFVFVVAYIGVLIFSNGSLAEHYSRATLLQMESFIYLPTLAAKSLLGYWAVIILIYIVYCWSVLCFSQLLGLLTKSSALSMFLPISIAFLLSDLVFNVYADTWICYLDIGFPLEQARTFHEAGRQIVQLPAFLVAFVAATFAVSFLQSGREGRLRINGLS